MLYVTGQIIDGKPVIEFVNPFTGKIEPLPAVFMSYAAAIFVDRVQFMQIRDSFTVGDKTFSPGDMLLVQDGTVVGKPAADFKAALQATADAIRDVLLEVASSKARGETPLYPDPGPVGTGR